MIQHIVGLIVKTSDFNPLYQTVTYIDKINLGAGDFMLKPEGDGKFNLKWITIRDVAKDQPIYKFLDYLFRSNLFHAATNYGFNLNDIIEALRRSLVEKYGESNGQEYFIEWLTIYAQWLSNHIDGWQQLAHNISNQNKDRKKLSSDFIEWIRREILISKNKPQFLYGWEAGLINDLINNSVKVDDQQRLIDLVKERKEQAQKVLARTEQIIAGGNRKEVFYDAPVYYIDVPYMNFNTWMEFDKKKRLITQVVIIASKENGEIIKNKLQMIGYNTRKIMIFASVAEVKNAFMQGRSLPHMVIFQGEVPAWIDNEWVNFTQDSAYKKKAVFIGLDKGDAADHLENIIHKEEGSLGCFPLLQLSIRNVLKILINTNSPIVQGFNIDDIKKAFREIYPDIKMFSDTRIRSELNKLINREYIQYLGLKSDKYQVLNKLKDVFKEEEIEIAGFLKNQAMITNLPRDKIKQQSGGIDLRGGNLIEVKKGNILLINQNKSGDRQFDFNPAILAKLENSPGFEPKIETLETISDLSEFLGITSN